MSRSKPNEAHHVYPTLDAAYLVASERSYESVAIHHCCRVTGGWIVTTHPDGLRVGRSFRFGRIVVTGGTG